MLTKFITLLLLFTAFSVSSGIFNEKNIMVNNAKRSYILKFPKKYDKEKKLPLIIALHAGGSNWRKFNQTITRNTLEKAANDNHILLVFPEGKNNYWNDGREKLLEGQQNYDDVKFISKLIDYSIEKYNVDPNKVFITGMSNGGFMAIRLAIELTEKVTAVASVSAQMSLKIKYLRIKQPISFMLINGTEDPVVPYLGGQMKLFKFSRNKSMVLSTKETISYFVKNNKCKKPAINTSQDKQTFDMTTLTINEYRECGDNTQVKLVKINGGGHTWPGGKQYLPKGLIGRLSKEINAGEVIVDFFLHNIK